MASRNFIILKDFSTSFPPFTRACFAFKKFMLVNYMTYLDNSVISKWKMDSVNFILKLFCTLKIISQAQISIWFVSVIAKYKCKVFLKVA